jgi:carboxypeptidase D
MNIYDVRLVDDYPACGMNWPPDLADVYPYLRVRPAYVSLCALGSSETGLTLVQPCSPGQS